MYVYTCVSYAVEYISLVRPNTSVSFSQTHIFPSFGVLLVFRTPKKKDMHVCVGCVCFFCCNVGIYVVFSV